MTLGTTDILQKSRTADFRSLLSELPTRATKKQSTLAHWRYRNSIIIIIAPLKLRPYGAIEIRLLLLLLSTTSGLSAILSP